VIFSFPEHFGAKTRDGLDFVSFEEAAVFPFFPSYFPPLPPSFFFTSARKITFLAMVLLSDFYSRKFEQLANWVVRGIGAYPSYPFFPTFSLLERLQAPLS